MLNLGGDKINPELVERVLAAAPGVADAAAFAIPNALGIDELWAAIVCRPNAADESALHTHCRNNLPVRFQPMHYVAVAAIPRNQFGKIERHRFLTWACSNRACLIHAAAAFPASAAYTFARPASE